MSKLSTLLTRLRGLRRRDEPAAAPATAAAAPSRWRQLLVPEPLKTVTAEAVPFQNGIDEITNAPTPPALKTTNHAIVVMLVVLVTLAAVIEVDMVVTATGRITVDTPPITLTPLDRSTIREVLVRPGDVVTKGQVLAKLDPTFARADMDALTARKQALTSEKERLESELEGKTFVAPKGQTGQANLQQTLSGERQSQYASQREAIDEEISRLTAMLRTLQDNRAALAQQLQLSREVEQMRATLMEKEVGSRLHYLDARNRRISTEREHQEVNNRIAELQHQLNGKRAERDAFGTNWRRQLVEDLVRVRTELTSVTEALNKATRVHDFVVITAPTDGIVIEVTKASVGSVLRDAEPLIHFVPSTVPLVADITIGSRDVGYTKPGDEVVIRMDAYPYHRHGFLYGRVRWISEQSFHAGTQSGAPAPPGAAVFHRATVELTTTQLERPRGEARIMPGMTLTADISVGRRSALGYFLYPLTNALHESLREP